MAISFNGITLTNPRIISESHSPSITITIQCITITSTDWENLIAMQSNTFEKHLLVSKDVKLVGNGAMGTLAMTGPTRNIYNCMIVPPVDVQHNANSTIWTYTVTFCEDTSI